MTDLRDMARRCYHAYLDKDRAAIEALIAEDFHFSSPLDNRIDRKTYFERCWPSSETISDFRFIRLVEHGHQVFVTYEGLWRGLLRTMRVPLLVLHGTADPVFPPQHGALLAESVTGARFVKLEGGGHELHPGHWDRIIEAIAAHAANPGHSAKTGMQTAFETGAK